MTLESALMNLFKRLSNSNSHLIGAEWRVFKLTPLAFIVGTILILSPALVIYLQSKVVTATQYQTIYICLGALFTYWFFLGVLAIGCFIIILMKGPGYVADAYQLPKEKILTDEPKH